MTTANNQLTNYNNQLGTLTGAAGNATTNQVQSEQNAATTLQSSLAGYQQQAAQAMSQVQFFNQLASTQGGLNATQQASYASAVQALAGAQASLAQAGLYGSQTTGQNLTNQQTQAAITAAAQKAATALSPAQQASANFLKASGATPGSIRSYNTPASAYDTVKNGNILQSMGALPAAIGL
jgi:hypothetical protein